MWTRNINSLNLRWLNWSIHQRRRKKITNVERKLYSGHHLLPILCDQSENISSRSLRSTTSGSSSTWAMLQRGLFQVHCKRLNIDAGRGHRNHSESGLECHQ